MKTLFYTLAIFSCLSLMSTPARAAEDLNKLKSEVSDAINVFKQTDPGIKKLFDTAAGYAVFPRIGKGGFIVGGAGGEGLVYERGRLVGRATLSQATVGAQVGGQVYRELIFFDTPETLQQFKGGKFQMSAQAGGVVAAEGAAETARFTEGVLVFTKPIKGVMAEASIGGQKFRFEPLTLTE